MKKLLLTILFAITLMGCNPIYTNSKVTLTEIPYPPEVNLEQPETSSLFYNNMLLKALGVQRKAVELHNTNSEAKEDVR